MGRHRAAEGEQHPEGAPKGARGARFVAAEATGRQAPKGRGLGNPGLSSTSSTSSPPGLSPASP
eukprot:1625216-Heterocapsa_arctica.AAC.1